jgi:homoserine O-acetyltransferase
MIHQDVARGGSLDAAAQQVRARVLAVVSEQDHMVNPAPALAFAPKIHAKVLILHSDCGHLAPNCEAQTVSKAVNQFLNER